MNVTPGGAFPRLILLGEDGNDKDLFVIFDNAEENGKRPHEGNPTITVTRLTAVNWIAAL